MTTTSHPPLPGRLSLYWLVPAPSAPHTTTNPTLSKGAVQFACGATLIADGKFAAGLPLVTGAELAGTPLAPYGRYYPWIALLGLRLASEAAAAFITLNGPVEGYLKEGLPLRMAEAALVQNDAELAVKILEDLNDDVLTAPEEVLVRLGAALEAAGKQKEAPRGYERVYFDFPLTTQASVTQSGLGHLETPALVPADRVQRSLARGEKLFAARRWAQARAGFQPLARLATKDNRELVALRLAECDYYLKRYHTARKALRDAEAHYFHLAATRALGNRQTYVKLARGLVTDQPDSSWAEETLNGFASHYVTLNDDEEADGVFRELARRFPRGRYGDRAAWKIGWQAYKHGQFAEAATVAFPRAHYRPS